MTETLDPQNNSYPQETRTEVEPGMWRVYKHWIFDENNNHVFDPDTIPWTNEWAGRIAEEANREFSKRDAEITSLKLRYAELGERTGQTGKKNLELQAEIEKLKEENERLKRGRDAANGKSHDWEIRYANQNVEDQKEIFRLQSQLKMAVEALESISGYSCMSCPSHEKAEETLAHLGQREENEE